MATRDVLVLNETSGEVQVAQGGDSFNLPRDTSIQGALTVSSNQTVTGNQTVGGTQSVAGTATLHGQVVVGGVSRNTWPTPGSAAVAIDDVLKNGHVSTRRMTLGGYDVSAIHQTLPIASFVDHDFFDNTDDAAWIDRQGHTSWENEVRHVGAQFMAATYANDGAAIAANPSIVSGDLYFNGTNFIEYGTATVRTRGSSRKFPMRGVVTAEAARVIIWSTVGGTPEMFHVRAVTGASSVCMSKASLVIGSNTGVYLDDYAADSIGGAVAYSTTTTPAVVNNTVNGVAITFLPDAPLDEYGTKIPTIAVATAGGVSVIKDVGSVVNSSVVGASWSIVFDGDTLVSNSLGNEFWVTYNVGSLAAGWAVSKGIWDSTIPAMRLTEANRRVATGRGRRYWAGSTALTVWVDNPTTPANGMVAYLDSISNSGLLVGDILRCYLANSLTVDRSVKGGTLVGAVATASADSLIRYSNFTTMGTEAQVTGETDFTTGSISVWANSGSGTAYEIFNRGQVGVPYKDISIQWLGSALYVSCSTNGTSWTHPLTFNVMNDTTNMHLIVVTSDGTSTTVYLDGVIINPISGSLPASFPLQSGTKILTFGGEEASSRLMSGSLALLRLSATALTPEQIAYMYKTEAPLFKTGAQALLSSGSNVTDLRYDKKTDQYIVKNTDGTTSKNDLFAGLERVASKLTTATDYTASNTAAIEAPAVTSLTGNVLNVPAVDVASELAAYRQASRRVLLDFNVVINGKFSSTSGWTYGAGWSNPSSSAVATAATTAVTSTQLLKAGKSYVITYSISQYVGGSVIFTDNGGGSLTTRASNGVFTETLTAIGTAISVNTVTAATLHIDNFFIRESADTLPMGVKPAKVWAGGRLQEEGTDYDVTFDGFLYGISFFIEPATNIQVEGEQV